MNRRLLIAGWMSLVLSACHSADGDLPREYRTIAVPAETLASADAVGRGRALFQKYCTLCHGTRGDGQGLQREGLQPPPRDFTDPAWRASTTPRHIFFAIREGRARTAMPNWKALSEQDGWDLTAYVLSLAGPR
jgi:mono/diheme cytochrome c family protein